MDKDLDALAKKIVQTKKDIPSITSTKCIGKFYSEISICLKDRTIKALFDSLTNNGFNIRIKSLERILRAHKKNTVKTPSNNNQSADSIPTDKNKETPKQNTELSVAPSALPSYSESEDVPIKKHLSNKEKAELRIAELGIDFNSSPLLKKRLKQLEDKNS